ncbi:MAG: HxsD-like protein [Myxococcota bacterium]
MRELRFSKEIYRGEDVDAALRVFEKYGDFEQEATDDAWVIRVSAGSRARERRLAGELGNYALGLTIRHRGVS